MIGMQGAGTIVPAALAFRQIEGQSPRNAEYAEWILHDLRPSLGQTEKDDPQPHEDFC